MPVVVNINPRSIYRKVTELKIFIEQSGVDLAFLSETWERENLPLENIFKMEKFIIISNVYQRKERGGRPAIIVNSEKFKIQNLTNTQIQVKWGVEVVWCLLTPKNKNPNNTIQHIACASVYVKPNSKKKSEFYDHIYEAYHYLNSKYPKGLHFIIAGDTNELNLDPIFNLNPKLVQVVQEPTRIDKSTGKESVLDTITTTLSSCYQVPKSIDPLDVDNVNHGKKSDHKMVLMKPISGSNQQSARVQRVVKIRPITKKGLEKMTNWLIDEKWMTVFSSISAHEKANNFQKLLVEKYELYFPEKIQKFTSEDQPWMNIHLKKLDRQRKRVYSRERRSEKWKNLNKFFKKELKNAKNSFYKTHIQSLKTQNPSKWYSTLKRLSSYDTHKQEKLEVTEICHLPENEQIELIANRFAKIQNEYEPINPKNIEIPTFSKGDIPQFSVNQVWIELAKLNSRKSFIIGDIPPKIIKKIAAYIAEPLTDIINTSIKRGEYPNIYKHEIITPIPKVFPCSSLDQLRNISGLFQFDKIMEKLISKLIISDMKKTRDMSQYGNEQKTSIQHYLIKLIHRILESTDKNSLCEKFAVVATLIDWKSAFSRQDHTLGVQSFVKNGVRGSLIPLLINYFEGRKMQVKLNGKYSNVKTLNGGGAQGASFGILEYLSQSNSNASCVPMEDRFKFIDDLTTLEIINLLSIGLSSYNVKAHIPSNIGVDQFYVHNKNLKTQKYLEEINSWTKNQMMQINEKKTKSMIFNFTNNYQFTTDLQLKNNQIEIETEQKLLGTIVQNNLSWDSNINYLVKKANARMQILHKISSFGASENDLKQIYFSYVRSILEQSSNVWHTSLSEENEAHLERIQKSALKIILKGQYINYEQACDQLNITNLKTRRNHLFEKFTIQNLNHPLMKDYFQENKNVQYSLRKPTKYKVTFSRTQRFKNSTIIQMQNTANDLHLRGKIL